MKKIGEELLKKKVDWVFNTSYSSHHGGIWKRQIRSIRNVLFSVIKQQTLTDESLRTLFCEVKNIINSRPVTTFSNKDEKTLPLSPNQILTMKEVSIPP